MGKFDGVLLVSDFDNTLIYTEGALLAGTEIPPLSARNREALECFMAGGGRFALATGRALASILPFAPEVPMNAPGVVCNGAAIYDFAQGEYLVTSVLNEKSRERGQEILERFPTMACEAYHIENTIHAVHPNAITYQHQHITHVAVEVKPSLLDVPLPLGKLLFEDEAPVLHRLQEYLLAQPWAGEYELIYSARNLFEMTRRGANKGGMVRELARRLDVRPGNIYCVGDQANDIPMLAVAAQAFAPANCIGAVREFGATIVADAEHDALAEVVERLEERYRCVSPAP